MQQHKLEYANEVYRYIWMWMCDQVHKMETALQFRMLPEVEKQVMKTWFGLQVCMHRDINACSRYVDCTCSACSCTKIPVLSSTACRAQRPYYIYINVTVWIQCFVVEACVFLLYCNYGHCVPHLSNQKQMKWGWLVQWLVVSAVFL